MLSVWFNFKHKYYQGFSRCGKQFLSEMPVSLVHYLAAE